jgi:MFS family permease
LRGIHGPKVRLGLLRRQALGYRSPMRRFHGLPGFFILWLGQAFSLLGGSMALFAVVLWVYQKTGEATPVALLGFFQATPMVVVSLFAGALVDRYDRRLMMMVGDLATLVVCLFLIGACLGDGR